MAVLSPQPKMQFTTAAGVPLSGGKVYTYTAGTTTPQATFTDSTGATPNPNPIILNSRGEANIWLGAATYKFRLTDANDVEIWTVDYISAPTSGVSPVLSGNVIIDSDTPGPALKITQTGTGPVLRVQDSADPDATPFIIDTNGNLGLGTATPTAQMEATGAAKIGSLTLTSSPLPVASGGTGRATLTANNVLIGAGTGNVTFVAPGANGNVLASNGTAWVSRAPTGTLVNVQVFTSSGTYTRTSGATRAVVVAVGGGGGGGGGSGGTGGTGGTTSFGAHVTAVGGSGGAANFGLPGAGGTGGAGALLAVRGSVGLPANVYSSGGGGGQGGGAPLPTSGSASGNAGVRGGGGSGAVLVTTGCCGPVINAGSGGGQGETATGYIASGLGVTETVTIGAGGAGGDTGGGVGGSGGAGYVLVYEYS